MSLDVQGIVAAAESHAQATGLFERVVTTEPKSAPGKGLSCSIWFAEVRPVAAAAGLDAVAVCLTLSVRVWKPMLSQPYGQIDPDMMAATDTLMAAYCSAFTLGGLVRNVDLLGQHGTSLNARSGYVTVDNQHFRIVDINLPLIINDLWTEVP